MGPAEAAGLVISVMEGAISAITATYDFERLIPDAKLLKFSEFGNAVINKMETQAGLCIKS